MDLDVSSPAEAAATTPAAAPAAAAPQPAPAPEAAAAAPKRSTQGEQSRIQKEVGKAQRQFEQTGSIQSLARLREIQAQMS